MDSEWWAFDVTNGEVMVEPIVTSNTTPWTRHGECDGCGECCLFVSTHQLVLVQPSREPVPSDYAYFKVRGFMINQLDDVASKYVNFYAPCPEHDAENRLCRVHERKPESCIAFPQHPDHIAWLSCSYWFSRWNDGKLELRGGKQFAEVMDYVDQNRVSPVNS